jgi:DNA modification methylase/DNA-binding XRE family transcriptional regulator
VVLGRDFDWSIKEFLLSMSSTEEIKNPFFQIRRRLKLTQRELAEILNTSLYALARWERGDLEPSTDILMRLNSLANPSNTFQNKESVSSTVSFASNGSTAQIWGFPVSGSPEVRMLDEPRQSILDGLLNSVLWGNSDLALSDILQRREKPALTREKPLNEEISAGKNTYTYDAHTYHTKVPPQGIACVISKYLPQGGLILDPFAGSGMTGVAARYLGCDVILNELSPAACFIAHNFVRSVDTHVFSSAILRVLANVENLRKELYTTNCRECGAEVEQLYTVWSYKLECNHCHEKFILWEHCRKYGNNVREHKLLKKFPCPHCAEVVNKSLLNRHGTVPVFLGYRCCSKKIVEHPLNEEDCQRIENARNRLAEYSNHFPSDLLPDGVNLNQPKRHGLDSIEKLYTERNLVACAGLWYEIKRIEDPELSAAVAFVFTSLYRRVTRLAEYRFWGGSGNTANFNVPHISNESNVFVTFKRKAKSIADHFETTAKNYHGRSVIRTGSATDLSFIPDNSVDFIFTDPPFGANINYSEMNILWESWLGRFTQADDEAIMNRVQGKGVDSYQRLMTDSLREAYRVLRPGHWLVLVFMNSSKKVWNALYQAITDASFSIKKINIFDKQHGTFKQYVSENTAGADLMIHCKKTLSDGTGDSIGRLKSIKSIPIFIEHQKGNVPVFPYLHVKRKSEFDYRTLYSRYIAAAIQEDSLIVNYAQFRKEAMSILERR